MYRTCRTAVVMPAFNAGRFLQQATAAVPAFVDHLIIVDDGSTDGSVAALAPRAGMTVIAHGDNRGVGAAIATGYAEALRLGAELCAVMAGDAQMDGADLPALLDPLVDGDADYVKGNRFFDRAVWRLMPPARLLGSLLLSALTRISSGYWHISDPQCGYTAANARVLVHLCAQRFWPRYGYPNDILARLRTGGARVAEVAVRPIYSGQPSGMRPWTIVHPITTVIARSFVRRLYGMGRQRIARRLPQAASRPLSQHNIG